MVTSAIFIATVIATKVFSKSACMDETIPTTVTTHAVIGLWFPHSFTTGTPVAYLLSTATVTR